MVAKTVSKKPRRKVSERRVRGRDGELMSFFTVDANSATFDDDLTYVFAKNVSRARQVNKRMFGSPEGLKKSVHKLSRPGSLDGIAKK
jgi:hypothetical protein